MNMNHALGDIFSSPLLARGPVRRLLLGLPFSLLFRFFLDGIFGFCHVVLLLALTLAGGWLFPRDGFAWPFTRARVCVRPLAAHRQVLTMAQAPIRSHINVPLDIHGHVASQITLDFMSPVKDLPDFYHVLVRQIVALQVEGDSGLLKNFSRGAPADSINVGERDFHPFASREIDSRNACHIFLLLLSNRFRVRALYPCLCLCLVLTHNTRTTPLRLMILHLLQIFFTEALTFTTTTPVLSAPEK